MKPISKLAEGLPLSTIRAEKGFKIRQNLGTLGLAALS